MSQKYRMPLRLCTENCVFFILSIRCPRQLTSENQNHGLLDSEICYTSFSTVCECDGQTDRTATDQYSSSLYQLIIHITNGVIVHSPFQAWITCLTD